MLESILSLMLDSARTVLPGTFVLIGVTYFLSAGFFFLVGRKLERTCYRFLKIQDKQASSSDYRREIFRSLQTIALFALVGTMMQALTGNPPPKPSPPASGLLITAHIFLVLLAHDAWFYWTHRLLHVRRIYRSWHKTHHRSTTPTGFAAFSFDWQEALVLTMFTILYSLLVPIPQMAALIFIIVMVIRNVWGHAGFELHPPGFADHWLFQHFTTTTHHDLHHSGSFGCNFGLYFTFWDRLMGTEHPQYRQIFREISSRHKDILEQE